MSALDICAKPPTHYFASARMCGVRGNLFVCWESTRQSSIPMAPQGTLYTRCECRYRQTNENGSKKIMDPTCNELLPEKVSYFACDCVLAVFLPFRRAANKQPHAHPLLEKLVMRDDALSSFAAAAFLLDFGLAEENHIKLIKILMDIFAPSAPCLIR